MSSTSIQYQYNENHTHLSSVDFVAQFGTGHRLNRLSLANFIADHLGFGLRTFWGFCPQNVTTTTTISTNGTKETNVMGVELRDVEIFTHLFGPQPLRDLTKVHATHQNILFVNKIYTGFHYVNRQRNVSNSTTTTTSLPTTSSSTTTTTESSCDCHSAPVQTKIKTDVQLYRTLRERFRATPTRVQAVRDEHFANACLVMGLHVRAGNGEPRHFARTARPITMDLTEWTRQVANHVRRLVREWGRGGNEKEEKGKRIIHHRSKQCSSTRRHSILFLATDTPTMIHLLKASLEHGNDHVRDDNDDDEIRVIELHQDRKTNGTGVWFGDKDMMERGDKCLTSWEDTLCDMILLSYADIVVSSRLSSFTETLPMSLAFAARQEQMVALTSDSQRKLKRLDPSDVVQQLPPAFCDLTKDASTMQCFHTYMEWCCNGSSSSWGVSTVELPNNDFFQVSYFNASRRPFPGSCNPKRTRFKCLPFEYKF